MTKAERRNCERVKNLKDPRLEKMAQGLINYSVNLKPGEKILIEVFDYGTPLALAVVKEVYRAGGVPFIQIRNKQLEREIILGANEEHLKQWSGFELAQMREMDAYIGIRAAENVNETADVPGEKQQLFMKNFIKPVLNQRIDHTKWCIMRYPTASFAQLANTSTEAFEDFYFDVCTLDYRRMERALEPLRKLMEATEQVRITGKDTDLSFSIRGIAAIPCAGKMNIPDGEIFTAPLKESVNGVISYNTPAVYQGVTYERIHFRFTNGRIVEAQSSDSERLNQILDTDEGARYIGEFALGVNPYILKPMKDTLFDEKINGSLHFTPGQAYREADNGNKSAVHWDLVLIQRPEYGGGEIYFDGKLVRKDGRFVLKELEGLNPENLI
jgi:aminopeptidase